MTVIVAAGNDSLDLQGPQGARVVAFLDDCEGALAITAAGPVGWAIDPKDADLYTPASYSNFGQTDFAGPGGDIAYYYKDATTKCTVGTLKYLSYPCWVFDMVFSCTNGGWAWAAGTSMATPGAAGIAALIISENGGKMDPAQVKAKMSELALDLGKTGYDQFYGQGYVHSGYFF